MSHNDGTINLQSHLRPYMYAAIHHYDAFIGTLNLMFISRISFEADFEEIYDQYYKTTRADTNISRNYFPQPITSMLTVYSIAV